MKQYTLKNAVNAFQISNIFNVCCLMSNEEYGSEKVTVTNNWIAHNEPKVGGYYVSNVKGGPIFMSQSDFENEYVEVSDDEVTDDKGFDMDLVSEVPDAPVVMGVDLASGPDLSGITDSIPAVSIGEPQTTILDPDVTGDGRPYDDTVKNL